MPVVAGVWIQDEDRSAAETGLAALADGLHTINGDFLRPRAETRLIAMAYWWAEVTGSGGDFIRGRLRAPSIRTNPLRFHRGLSEWDGGAHFGLVYDYRDNPLNLVRSGEDVEALITEADEAGVAHVGACVVFFSSGPITRGFTPPITHQVRGALGATTALAWTATDLPITLEDTLAPGIYKMHGLECQSATAVVGAVTFQSKLVNGGLPRPFIPHRAEEGMYHPYNRNWGIPDGPFSNGGHFVIPDGLPNIRLVTQAAETPSHVELYLQKVA